MITESQIIEKMAKSIDEELALRYSIAVKSSTALAQAAYDESGRKELLEENAKLVRKQFKMKDSFNQIISTINLYENGTFIVKRVEEISKAALSQEGE